LALHWFAAEMSTTGISFDGSTPAQEAFIMAKKLMGLLAALAVIGGASSGGVTSVSSLKTDSKQLWHNPLAPTGVNSLAAFCPASLTDGDSQLAQSAPS
jgi:hypothetical protein